MMEIGQEVWLDNEVHTVINWSARKIVAVVVDESTGNQEIRIIDRKLYHLIPETPNIMAQLEKIK